MKKQIQLVDDDPKPVEALLWDSFPHRQQWQVATAGNSAELLRLACEQLLNLLVADILMPKKGGIETVVALRRKHLSVKIVAMSGEGTAGGQRAPCQRPRFLRPLNPGKPFDCHPSRDTFGSLLDPEPATTSCPEGGES